MSAIKQGKVEVDWRGGGVYDDGPYIGTLHENWLAIETEDGEEWLNREKLTKVVFVDE